MLARDVVTEKGIFSGDVKMVRWDTSEHTGNINLRLTKFYFIVYTYDLSHTDLVTSWGF